MSSHSDTLPCRYQYDALDRLVVSKPSTQSNALRFYLGDHLATEIQGAKYWSLMQHENQLLAQQQRQSGALETRLFGTDKQRSVLNVPGATQLHPFAYTPYGYRIPQNDLLSPLGFNGERPDPLTGCYLLGNGYRAFNPVLMRFNSPDSWSPFGEGGLNAYAYCVGDPVNRMDKTGHAPRLIAWLTKKFIMASSEDVPLLNGSSNLAPAPSTRLSATLARNIEKLRKVENRLINLKEHPETVIRTVMDQNSDATNMLGRQAYEAIIRQNIPKEIAALENKKIHYVEKIERLQAQSSTVRQR